jgi:dihydrofolate reductase
MVVHSRFAVSLDGFIADPGASIVQEAINGGLVDEIRIDLVPVFLGAGIPYFAGMDPGTELDCPVDIVAGKKVTHLRYKIEHRHPQNRRTQ